MIWLFESWVPWHPLLSLHRPLYPLLSLHRVFNMQLLYFIFSWSWAPLVCYPLQHDIAPLVLRHQRTSSAIASSNKLCCYCKSFLNIWISAFVLYWAWSYEHVLFILDYQHSFVEVVLELSLLSLPCCLLTHNGLCLKILLL